MHMRELAENEVYALEECLRELADHHNKVSALFGGTYPKHPFRETLASFEGDVRNGLSRIAAAEEDGKVLGFIKADIRSGDGKIDYLVVRKEARGKGYGKQLMEWALDLFRNSGVRTVEVRVVDGNDAEAFYEKFGFRVCSQILRLDS